MLKLRTAARDEYTKGPKTQEQLDKLLLKYPPSVMQAEFPQYGNTGDYNNATREAYARTEQQERIRNREAMRASGQEVSVANPGGNVQTSGGGYPTMSAIPQAELDRARAKLTPEQAAFIDWKLAQVNPMTGQRVADDYARQGTNPYAGNAAAQAQEQIDRGVRRTDLLSSSGVSTAGIAAWTDPNWRASQQAKEDAERARMDKQRQDWYNVPEAQRTVAGPGGPTAPTSGYGNYLDKQMYTAPTAKGGILDWYNANVGRTDDRAQADLDNFLKNSGYTAEDISTALPQWSAADLAKAGAPSAAPEVSTAGVQQTAPAAGAQQTSSPAATTQSTSSPAATTQPTTSSSPFVAGPVDIPSAAPTALPAPDTSSWGYDAPSYSSNVPDTSSWGYASGGIAALGAGGYPRRTGQISGPGTEKSDSIPAMLSDGEFVMTAKAVRGAGKGSRREGAKRMYKLMHQLEKNSQRG